MSDVLDILDVERPQTPEVTKESILGTDAKKKKKRLIDVSSFKRPEGMHRELYALLYADQRDPPPLITSDTGQGYKQVKAKLGLKKVRPWKWMPFNNPARKDNIFLCHWRRVADENKEYPFAKFNKVIQIPTYNDTEYQQHLNSETWNRVDTDYLMDMCRRFDLRFIIIHDRWDKVAHGDRSVEDLKERYYGIYNILAKLKGPDTSTKIRLFDADNERRRKEQLIKLYNRTPEQVEEEQTLLNELRKIEQRKREREKKTQDLQKLITAADSSAEARKTEKKGGPKKRLSLHKNARGADGSPLESAGIKFPEIKACGVSLRSHTMKLPTTVGQKKTKTIEQLLQELSIDLNPMPTEEISTHFNELRSDMVLLYELKLALATCEFELQTLRHQFEALAPGKSLEIPAPTLPQTSQTQQGDDATSPEKKKTISEIIDVGSSNTTPSAKKLKRFLQDHHYFR